MLSKTQWKCLLLGGSATEASAYLKAAASRGWEMQHFSSMDDLGYLGRVREFDAAIVHQDLHPLSGLELAEYFEKLFQSLPMVLLTSKAFQVSATESLPGSIIDCLPKAEEPSGVLRRVEEAVLSRDGKERSPLRRRLAWFLS